VDLATIVGIFVGLILITIAIMIGGSPGAFLDPGSVLITFGGTICGTLINYNISQLTGMVKVIKNAFLGKAEDSTELVATIVRLAEKARREGILALDAEANKLDDPFLQKGLRLVIDGTDPDLAKDILETELAFLEERHKLGKGICDTMAGYFPAWGMIGTLIGLIQMLKNLSDPSKVGPGMATALLTTFYGAFMAYLLMQPIAGKLDIKSSEEILHKEVMIEGILSIQAGNNPRIIEEKLKSFFSPKVRSDAGEKVEKVRKSGVGKVQEAGAAAK
jgi:chemotaxis protein MotA